MNMLVRCSDELWKSKGCRQELCLGSRGLGHVLQWKDSRSFLIFKMLLGG